MSLDKQEPQMSRNYWLAMVLSLIILIGYPYLIQKTVKKAPLQEDDTFVQQIATSDEASLLSGAKGPFLEQPLPPTLLRYENEDYEIQFSTLGGTVTQLVYKGELNQHNSTRTVFYDQDPNSPGLFGLSLSNEKADLTHTLFKVQQRQDDAQRGIFEFMYEKPGEYRITKRFQVSAQEPTINLTIQMENLSDYEKHFPVELQYALQAELTDRFSKQYIAAVAQTDTIESGSYMKVRKKGFMVMKEVFWAGLVKKYFALIIKPNWKAIADEAKEKNDALIGTLKMEPVSVGPGRIAAKEVLIYAGPQRHETLKREGAGFEKIMSRGFFGPLKVFLLQGLKFFNRYTHNYGWAIIILTLLIKVVFAPITSISFKSQKKMQAIQPKLKSIQERYKDNPEKLQKETMELFKKHRVNPMAGCLPMLIQMPILLAMFRILPEAIELNGAPFIWWIKDLSQPDQLIHFSFTIPVLGWTALNVLPILMAASQFGFQKIMPQASTSNEQAKVFALMPIFFGFICYNMPSGLVLYWIVQNALSIVHHTVIHRDTKTEEK
ncbi:MAG: membrane protein insertase YidC [Candidatus Omnitrophica bacterium]|nr:membrane protein insertase YidC [Candidatus Omnitrophota bacterium]